MLGTRRRSPGAPALACAAVIRLERHGPDDGMPPLVAIPGIDGSIGSIAPMVERLACSRPVVVVNFSDERNPTFEALADEIAGVLKSEIVDAGAPHIDLWGQSIGTLLAAQLAVRPELVVRRVVLVGTWTRLRWSLRRPWAPLQVTNRLTALLPRPLYRASTVPLMAVICGPVGDGRRHPFFAHSKRSDRDDVVRRTEWEVGRDFTPELSRIEQPTLVLLGRKDRFVPDAEAEITKLRAIFAGQPARVEAVPGGGHVLLPSAAIADAAQRMEGFLDGPTPPPAGEEPSGGFREELLGQVGVPFDEQRVDAGSVGTTYLEAGSGPPVVLLHGASGGGAVWAPVIGPLSERFRVIVPDMVGYGASDKPRGEYDKRYFSRWLGDFLAALDLRSVHLVGNSSGGCVALQYALDRPESVDRLVLTCSEGFGPLPVLPQVGIVVLNVVPNLATARWLTGYLAHDASKVDPAVARYVVEVCRMPGGKRVLLRGRGRLVRPFPAEQLRMVDHQTLLLWSRENRFAPVAHAEAARAEMPNARLELIDQAGHLPFLEQPGPFNQALLSFLGAP
jgi:2-hydroxymuconate-semialdehyde hydrolase